MEQLSNKGGSRLDARAKKNEIKERVLRENYIKERMKDDDEYLMGALIALYNCQTADEKEIHGTKYQNDMGFNGVDAGFLTDVSQFFLRTGFVTEKQIKFVRKTIIKYWGQVERLDPEPLSIKAPEKKRERGDKDRIIKWAGIGDDGTRIQIKFTFPKGDPRFRDTLAQVKTLSGRRWDGKEKVWKAFLNIDSVKLLREWGFTIANGLEKWFQQFNYDKVSSDLDKIGLGLKKNKPNGEPLIPRRYQKEGVAFGNSRKGRFLIGDEMGVGKTAQGIIWAYDNKEVSLPALVIVPGNAKLNWEREFEMWTDLNVGVIEGRYSSGRFINLDKDVIVINYDILPDKFEMVPDPKDEKKKIEKRIPQWESYLLENFKPKTIILDEAHYIKNNDALRTKAAKRLAENAKFVIPITGTPITSRPVEFFNALNIIAPERFPSFWEYAHEYCGATHNGFGWDFTGATNKEKLHRLLTETVMIRRLKKEVLPELPDKVRTVVPIDLSNVAEYRRVENDFIGWVNETSGHEAAARAAEAEHLTLIGKLKQVAVKGKMKGIFEWIDDFLLTDEKLVLFSWHQSVIDEIQKRYKDISVRITGNENAKKKQAAVDVFQNDPKIKICNANLKAGGVSITLTAASNVGIIELPWTPGELDQAEDRIHRFGQTAKGVNYWYLLAHQTVEEDIAELLDAKREVLAAILDGREVKPVEMIKELMDRVRNRRG